MELDRDGVRTTVVGGDLAAGQRLQHVVQPGTWFGATPCDGTAWALVGGAGTKLSPCVPGTRGERTPLPLLCIALDIPPPSLPTSHASPTELCATGGLGLLAGGVHCGARVPVFHL